MEVLNEMTVTGIDSVLTVRSEKGRKFEMKCRQSYAITFARGDGCIVYHKDGKKYVSDKDHAILIPKGADYMLTTPQSGDFPLINFTASSPISDFLRIPLGNPESYQKDYARLRDAWVTRGDHAKAMSILYEIISRLSHEENGDSDRIVHPAAVYIAAHYSDPSLQNETLAALVGLSEVYFRRCFREAYGVSPRQYLIDLRIKNAKQLLAEGTHSVTEIADICGFSGVYHFCRAFKNATGETPTAYRKKERL